MENFRNKLISLNCMQKQTNKQTNKKPASRCQEGSGVRGSTQAVLGQRIWGHSLGLEGGRWASVPSLGTAHTEQLPTQDSAPLQAS